jgi:cytochrome o ubiquinol oxidase subunit II
MAARVPGDRLIGRMVALRRRALGAALTAVAVAAPMTCAAGVTDPAGPIGRSEMVIMTDALAIMLAIVIPVIIATLVFAWWFRASNTRARYRPDFSFSGRLELLTWSIPIMVVMFLGGIAWTGSHDLDPARPLASSVQPVEVEVVSLDWKWLFIYPDQGLASVNQLVVPAGTPVHFRLTSASVMNSFFVPQLGSQIYTMAGMTTQLNLLADKPGIYQGLSAQYSGAGFSEMRFHVIALPPDAFTNWVAATHAKGGTLDPAAYAALVPPSQANPAVTYGSVSPDLFQAIVMQSAPGSMGAQVAMAQPPPGKN